MTIFPIKKHLSIPGLLFCGLVLSGCGELGYYRQAIQGQYHMMAKRRPIAEITRDSESPESLQKRLAFILRVREFARSELHLPVDNNYRHFVDLDKPHVAWTVSATPEFSLTPHTWCYPVVGCAAYRGYFSKEEAERYAAGLKSRGLDVCVSGVYAYSTLGWFDDPVLSTFLRYSAASVAALIFHELAHRKLYVKGDTAFNEGFASFVEQEGLRRWQSALENPDFYEAYIVKCSLRREFIEFISQYRERLESLYHSPTPESEKRKRKASIFSDLRKEFHRRKAMDAEWAAYDVWMSPPLNNVKICTVAIYNDFVPAFRKILAEKKGDMAQFYEACRKLTQVGKAARHQVLRAYLEANGVVVEHRDAVSPEMPDEI
ncbi:MAG: aminopeptidase [Desulfobacterales bacterium]